MLCFAPIRFVVAAGLALSASLPAQSPQTKPAVAPQAASALPAMPLTTPAPPPQPLTPAQLPPNRAQITYADGALSVSANNSSLNQILRQIGSDTGIKITGGVTDERVFGRYGPASPAQILAELLDGTGSNMILMQHDAATPAELILTPRQGGPTPPNPSAHAFDDRPNRPDRPEPEEPAPAQAVQPGPVPAPNSAPMTPGTTPGTNPGTPAGTSQANPSQPESPNGVKTPQQIYEQLQRLRSQQQQQSTQPQ